MRVVLFHLGWREEVSRGFGLQVRKVLLSMCMFTVISLEGGGMRWMRWDTQNGMDHG